MKTIITIFLAILIGICLGGCIVFTVMSKKPVEVASVALNKEIECPVCPVCLDNEQGCPECPVCLECPVCPMTYEQEYRDCVIRENNIRDIYAKFESLNVSMLSVIDPARYEVGVWDCSQYSEALIQELADKGIMASQMRGYWNGTSHVWVGVWIESQYGRFIGVDEDYRAHGTTVFKYGVLVE